MENEKGTFCVIPSLHLSIRQNGLISPCCLSQEELRKDNGKQFNINRMQTINVQVKINGELASPSQISEETWNKLRDKKWNLTKHN